MRAAHEEWVQASLNKGDIQREKQWSESIAVGNPEFLIEVQNQLHGRCAGRQVVLSNGIYQLREAPPAYPTHFDAEKRTLSLGNDKYSQK
jgi:hypothetical protein